MCYFNTRLYGEIFTPVTPEVQTDSPTKLSKSERKLARKQAKACHMLLKHDGILTVTHQTPYLLVANGGLGNGIQRGEILNIFSSIGPVEDVVMLRGKPYCFVKYSSTSLATSAMQRLNGHCMREGQGPSNVTLYLSFVESVPADKPQALVPPSGLVIIPDFIDESLEHKLVDSINWETSSEKVNPSLKHRKVKHHGYEFKYSTNNIDIDQPLPGGMPELYGHVIDRIMGTGHVQFKPDQLTINQYQPGQGIPPHVDTHSAFEDAIISLSLESQVVMEFTDPEGHQVPIVLPRRSLLIMMGEARYKWTHGIIPKKTDVVPDPTCPDSLTLHPRAPRTSFTFRAVRRGPCHCKYPEQCDSQKSKAEVTAPPQVSYPKSEQEAAKLEAQQVHVVYNNIAQHFSGTRYKAWPRVVDFLNGLETGSVVLDIGCGNGKYLGVNKNLHMIGCDRSNQLIDICRVRGLEGLVCDSLALPFGNGRMSACICIAVIHHMSTRARRLQALREISRVLCPGGVALVTVWAMEQERKKEKSKYISKKGDTLKNTSNSASWDRGDLTDETRRFTNSDEDGGSTECDPPKEAHADESKVPTNNTDEEKICSIRGNEMQCDRPRFPLDSVPLDSGQCDSGQCDSSQCDSGQCDLDQCDSGQCNLGQGDPGQCDSGQFDSGQCEGQKPDGHNMLIKNVNGGVRSGIDRTIGVRSGIDHSIDVRSRICNKSGIPSEAEELPIYSADHNQTSLDDANGEHTDDCSPGETIIVHKNRTQFEQQDLLVPWHLKGQSPKTPGHLSDGSKSVDKEVFFRFYHVFVEGEMEALCQTIEGVRVIETYYDQGNWCVVFQKL